LFRDNEPNRCIVYRIAKRRDRDSRYRRAGRPALHAITVACSPIRGDDSTVPDHNKVRRLVFSASAQLPNTEPGIERSFALSQAPCPAHHGQSGLIAAHNRLPRGGHTRIGVNNSSLSGSCPRALPQRKSASCATAGCSADNAEANPSRNRVDVMLLSTKSINCPNCQNPRHRRGTVKWRRSFPGTAPLNCKIKS
jgi:hypothetical protein